MLILPQKKLEFVIEKKKMVKPTALYSFVNHSMFYSVIKIKYGKTALNTCLGPKQNS